MLEVKGSNLWPAIDKAYSQVYRSDRRFEICLAASFQDQAVRVLKDNSILKYQATVPAVVDRDVRIVISDARFVQYLDDISINWHKTNENIIMFNNDKITLSSANPDFFEVLGCEGPFGKLPKGARKLTWVLGDKNIGLFRIAPRCVEMFFSTGDHPTILGWCKAGEDEPDIVDNHVCLPGNVTTSLAKDTEIFVEDAKAQAVWLQTNNTLIRRSTAQVEWDGQLYLDRLLSMSDDVPWIKVMRDEFLESLRYIETLSINDSFKNGLADFHTTPEGLKLRTAAVGVGSATRTIKIIDSSPTASEVLGRLFPNQYRQALDNLDSDEVILESRGNGILVRGNNIYFAIAGIYVQ